MFVFIDETGDHNLNHIDPLYPIFALGALLISKDEYKKLNSELDLIKKEFFGDNKTFILHSSELKRPYDKRSDTRNAPMLDPDTRKAFYSAMDNRILKAFDFKIVVCVVKKQAMKDAYTYPMDPYHFSFENLLNRVIMHGGDKNHIYAEKRGKELDTELESEYEKLLKVGIHSYPSEVVKTKTKFYLIPKSDNENGLQLIDMILSAWIRKKLGKEERMKNNDLTPALIETKIVASTIFPKKRR